MTTKLKYSALPPFRWYPVELVDLGGESSPFAAFRNFGEWRMEYVDAYGDACYCDSALVTPEFVMRLETPEQQAIRVIAATPGVPPEEWATTPAYHAPQSNWNDISSLGDWSDRITELGKHQSWIIPVADGSLKRIEDCTEEELRAFAEAEKARMQ